MNLDFDIDTALQLSKSQDKFPVSFSDAFIWLQYSRKDVAKKSLLNCGFIENTDYHIETEPTTTGISEKLNENIFLTVDCFKHWSMMSGTEQGKQVRLYFLECEKLLKQQQETNQLVLSGDVATTLFNFIQEQKLITSELMKRTKKLDQIEEASKTHKGARAVIDSEDNEFKIKECVSVDQYLISLGLLEITPTSKNAIHRRAATFYRTDKHCEPKKLGNKNVYYGSEVEYIKQATKSVLGL